MMARLVRLSAAIVATIPLLAAGAARAQWVTTTSPLPDATAGTAYTLQFAAAGGTGGYVWWYGCCPPCPPPGCPPTTDLPQGLSFSHTGLLQGTPLTSGDFSFWVWVDDSTGAGGVSLCALHVRPSASWTFSKWVPVATHTSGLGGTEWRTDVAALNPGAVAANVEVDFHGAGGVASATASIPPGTQVVLADVVGQLGTTGSGALEVLSDQPVEVASRTYDQFLATASCFPGGTQGQDYPALDPAYGLPNGQAPYTQDSAYLLGLAENARFRSNIGLVNTGIGAASVLVELFDGAGNKLTGYTSTLASGQWSQAVEPFRKLAGQTAMDSGYAKVTVQSGYGVFPFASVIDNITGDPTTVTKQLTPSFPLVWLPVASHVAGLNGADWRTDVWVLNARNGPAPIEVVFLDASGVVSTTASIPPGAQLLLADVVGQLGASGSGALIVDALESQVWVASRTYDQLSPGASCFPGGTQGQDYPAVDPIDSLQAVWSANFGVAGQTAYLPGLVENAGFRSNIGLVNTGPDAASVLVELFDGTGNKLTDYTVALASGEWSQAVEPFRKLAGQTAMDNGYARVTVQQWDYGVFAFASVIDNLTNDPTTVVMQR
ncbi:MAG: putative Ig domain-containing protein [Thermoanaerobaculaceae bacterium]